jgi:hypothetical protein
MDGAVSLHVCGETRRLRFSWGVLAEFRSQYGPDFQDKINAAVVSLDFEIIARVLAAGLSDVSHERIMRDSPPIVSTLQAINRAFNVAYHGPSGEPQSPLGIGRRAVAKIREALQAIRSKIRSKLG